MLIINILNSFSTIVNNFLKKKYGYAVSSKKSCNFAADFLRQKRS